MDNIYKDSMTPEEARLRLEEENNLRKELGWQDFIDKLGKAAAGAATLNGKAPTPIDLSAKNDQRSQLLAQMIEERRNNDKNSQALKMKEIEQTLLEKRRSDDRDFQKMMFNDRRNAAINEKNDQKMEKQVERLSDKLNSSQELVSSINDLENELGFKLDDYDTTSKTVKNKPVDVPGVSVPGLGRVKFYSSDARNLETKLAKIFNVTLRDRSGSAVTNPELERLKSEFASGKFNTEDELLKAAKEYKNAAILAMKNFEAGVKPEAVAEYQSRGGITSESVKNLPVKESDKNITGGTAIADTRKTIVDKKYSPSRNKTRIKYSDGSEELLDGRQ